EQHPWPFKAGGPGRSAVPVEAADALQQDVHWAQIADEPIGVNVQALLQGLRADEQQRTGRSVLAQTATNGSVEHLAVLARKTAVVRAHHAINGEQRVPRHAAVNLDRP